MHIPHYSELEVPSPPHWRIGGIWILQFVLKNYEMYIRGAGTMGTRVKKYYVIVPGAYYVIKEGLTVLANRELSVRNIAQNGQKHEN